MVCSGGWFECHPGTAAWVQAVGAIIAILAGALLLHYQSTLQRRNRIKGLAAIVDLGIRAVTRRLSVPDDEIAFDFFVTLNAKEIRFAYDTLCKIPLHEIESVDAVKQVAVMIEMTRRVLLRLEAGESSGALNPHEKTLADTTFKEEVTAMRDARKRLRDVTRSRWWMFSL
ncbi:hypothetical protein PQR67_06250 [Paraburkholderia fungorum]|uniref:hypothetical protein n=1 Tax=Paraburkholderia fungorum TaxID=134537 RepID=UPI0038BCC2A9